MKLDQVSSYEDAVSYIEMIPRFLAKNTKEMTDAFYLFIDKNREGSDKEPIVIHVAGTNGKGSVCAFLKSIGKTMGKSVGMFTSPHLITTRERILIADKEQENMISREDFLRTFHKLLDAITQFQNTDILWQQYHPSYFEFLFFMAVLYFNEKKPDIIIWETGLGGRLDATNSLTRKNACIITEIGLDHMEYLGDTFSKIASEKAGILKAGVPVIYCQKRPDVSEVIQKKAKDMLAPLFFVSKDDGVVEAIGDKYIDFSYKSRYYDYVRLQVKGLALYQVENASLALRCAECLFSKEELTVEVMQRAIKEMFWAGRMEEISPGVWIDGAHNEDGIHAFIESVRNDSCEGKRSLLFSAVSDKRFVEMTELLKNSKLFSRVYVTRLESYRGIALEELRSLFKEYEDVHVYEHTRDAFEDMMMKKTDKDYIYVAGSLYLVGELKGYLEEKHND